ncbi:hypothetical protein A8B78_08045 [Jannaschia sp. EhC01]|nr:hypothetical protein A8B78_08045 [Jannaschia sp. EhC01]
MQCSEARASVDCKGYLPSTLRARSVNITYIWTREGWLYLAVILDLHSRRVIGWAVSTQTMESAACLMLSAQSKKGFFANQIDWSDRPIESLWTKVSFEEAEM